MSENHAELIEYYKFELAKRFVGELTNAHLSKFHMENAYQYDLSMLVHYELARFTADDGSCIVDRAACVELQYVKGLSFFADFIVSFFDDSQFDRYWYCPFRLSAQLVEGNHILVIYSLATNGSSGFIRHLNRQTAANALATAGFEWFVVATYSLDLNR